MKRRFFADELLSRRKTTPLHDCSVGSWELYIRQGTIRRGDETRRIEPQVMALLAYLAERPHRVVSRQELLREVWGGTSVSDGAITRCVGAIRKALDDGTGVDPIRTLPKRGYQLVAPVTRSGVRSPAAPVSRWKGRTALLAAVTALVLVWAARDVFKAPSSTTVVAVGAFHDLDTGAHEGQWGRSIADEVMADLLAAPALTVIRAAPGNEVPVREADVVLSGSVRKENGRARVYCELTRAATQRTLCSGVCDVDASTRLASQRQVAKRMAAGIHRSLGAR